MTGAAVDDAGEPLRLLVLELEQARREELQRIQIQHFEKVRQIESGRLHAEQELEALKDRFAELSDFHRAETARLHVELERAKDEVLDSVKSLAEQNKTLARVEGLRDALDRERAELLERLRDEALRNAQSRKRLDAAQRALADRIETLKAEKTLLVESVDQLNEERKAREEHAEQLRRERVFYRRAMMVAEQRLRLAETGFRRQFGQAVAVGFTSWRGFVRLPSAVWSAVRGPVFGRRSDTGAWLNQVEEVFAKHGASASEDFVRINAASQIDLAAGLTKLARLLARNDPSAALPMATEAAQMDPRPFRRKWLAFMSFDAGHIEAAHELLASLTDRTEFKASEKNKADYIAGCHRLLHGALVVSDFKATIRYSPVSDRILYVAASSLPYHVTGYTMRTHGLLGALTAQGLDVRCVTRPGYPADQSDSNDADDTGAQAIDGIAYETLPGPHRRKLGLDAYLLKSAEILAEKAKAERVAAIHAASNYETALPALLAARMLGIPFIYEVRSLWEYTSASKQSGWEQSERFDLERRLESLTAKNADHVLTLTGALSDELCSRGVEKSNITLAPNSIDVDAFPAAQRNRELAVSLGVDDDDFVIGYVGSVVAYEGLDDLIEALFLLKVRLPRARVLVVGDGDSLPDLRELAQARGVADRLIFCGKVDRERVRDYYALMDAVALPRKPVTVCQLVSPLKLLEAMALGIPLIVSDVDALKEMVVDGETALIHLAGNARSLADSIDMLAKTPALQSALAANGRADVAANRSCKQVARIIVGIYRDLANAKVTNGELSVPAEEGCHLTPIPIPMGKHSLNEQELLLLDQKLAFALTQGAAVLHAFLSEQRAGNSKRLGALLYLRAAKVFLDAGEEAEALALGEAALRDDSSATSLRGAARLFYYAAHLDRAQDLAMKLERSLGDVRTNDRKLIDEILGRARLVMWAGLPAQVRTLAKQPQRVLNVLAFSLPYTSVGYATRSHGLALGVKNAGWDIRPYTRPGFPYDFKIELEGQPLPDQDQIEGVTYGRLFDCSRKGRSEVEYMLAAVEHYEHIIRKEEPEIVHAASNYVTALPALIAARRLGIPFVYEVRGFWDVTRSSRDDKFENTPKYRFMQLFEALTTCYADHVITITTAMKEELMARGVSEERISIAYNSVDPDRFVPRSANLELAAALGIPPGVPVIGYVGSFVDYEGLDDLVSASASLKAAGRDFRLLLVGDGPVFDELKRQVEAVGIQDKTIMTGRVLHDLVGDYYTLIDIAPFPRKPWKVCELVSPLKPYEAMALEKAVIVSGTRALMEIVTHDKNGLVFVKGDVVDLQGKLDELLSDRQKRTELGRNAREWIRQERSWDVAGSVCGDVYRKFTGLGVK